MTTTVETAAADEVPVGKRKGPRRGGVLDLLRIALRKPQGWIGATLLLVVVLVAFVGPFVAPYSPGEILAAPYTPPGGDYVFGTDGLGRDVLSRFLSGGNVILLLALASAVLGVGVGTVLGLIAGYRRGVVGAIIMRTLDIVLSFPSLLLALLFLSIIGPKAWLITATIAISHVPYVARVVESSSLALTGRGFVQYAEMIGVPRRRILLREILPSITAPLTVQFGIRLTWSIGSIASLAYLGMGRQAPDVDWGMMINENQVSIVTSPLTVLVPVAAIAVVTIGANMLADAFGQASGVQTRRSASS